VLFRSRSLPNPNYLGAPLVLLVTGYQNGWVQAYVPTRPNESTAWIPSADVAISYVSQHIVISLKARQLTLYRDNAPVFQTAIAPGAPSSPTPTGSFFVAYMVKLTDPTNVYGPYAMGTSAFSNTYYSFDGGPGQVGIHGTNQPWVIGSYASHGCVRLNNDAITTLAQEVTPGTPVEIGP
jgi:lipoprotein-anchoring transpeptidase ErfK/SrfK